MGYDNKYGQVTTERGTIGLDEPVVVFRAQDRLLPELMRQYLLLCEQAGSPERHLGLIRDSLSKIETWQAQNFTKTPSSDALVP